MSTSTSTTNSKKRVYPFTLPQQAGESSNQTLKKLKMTQEREFFLSKKSSSKISITLKPKSSISREPIERLNNGETFEESFFANRVVEKESLRKQIIRKKILEFIFISRKGEEE